METTPRPWGRTAAILIGSYVTLIGLWSGLDPEIILMRSAAAAIVSGCLMRVLIDMVPRPRESD